MQNDNSNSYGVSKMDCQRDLFSEEVAPENALQRKAARVTKGFEDARVRLDKYEFQELLDKFARLEATLDELRTVVLQQERQEKESYSTTEIASILGKRPYTVREWCRLARVRAHKAMCGRGSEEEWRISHEELLRIQNEGLLPAPKRY